MGDREIRTSCGKYLEDRPRFFTRVRDYCPAMNPRHVDLVRDSFVQVLVDSERAAHIFYDRLFELAPDTRPMFRKDMAEQGRLLIDALARIVTGLSRLDAMLPSLRKLAERHVGYGVEHRHYAVAGEALVHMIKVHGGPAVDAQTIEAWKVAYALVADAMIAATPDAREMRDAA